MTDERWRRTENVLEAVLELAPDARAAYLDAACANDAALRAEVESLLAREARAERFLEGTLPLPAASVAPSGGATSAAWHRLAPGSQLGPYRIDAFLGAGGMGAVFKATDARLGRTVAIKVLTTAAGSDVDRRRLEKEARSASALNHPHICTVHDIGSDGGTPYLVMEYLDGETLAARIERSGALPLPLALDVSAQIAGALGAAHRAGIVHRDLKPGNIMLVKAGPGRTGLVGVKLLDFGLARNTAPDGPSHDSISTTGLIVGTVPYMAPEQIAGRAVDARTDLFAFGAVLFEMLAGRRAFDADSQAGVIAAIMERDPAPITDVQPLTPPALDRLVRKCLAKDPEARWQNAADVADELRWIAEGHQEAAGMSRPRRLLRSLRAGVAAGLLLAVSLAGFLAGWASRRPTALPALHASVSLAEQELTVTGNGVAISPDGMTLAVCARRGDEEEQIYLRPLTARQARPLKGTNGAKSPFFSPDGKWIVFAAKGDLVKVLADGDERQVIGPADYQGISRGCWTPDGRIIFSHWPGGLSIVPASGGTPVSLLHSDNSFVLWPQLLPGGETVLFTELGPTSASVIALTLADKRRHVVIPKGRAGRYLPSGHLVFEREGSLYATRFDPRTLTTSGESRLVMEDIAASQTGSSVFGDYDVSASGTLVGLPVLATLTRPVWRDREGRTWPLPLEPRRYQFPALSPDGRSLAVTVDNAPTTGIWTGSVDREPLTPLTRRGRDVCSIFSRDGRLIAFSSDTGGGSNLCVMSADGSSEPHLLGNGSGGQKPTWWSNDGRWIFYNQARERSRHIMRVGVDGQPAPERVVTGDAYDIEAALSPDERWMAYQSNATRQWEVYVRPYPGPGGARQVSVKGGRGPVWNPRGGELFYQTANALMSVTFRNGEAQPPVKLFSTPRSEEYRREFDVAPGGDRFLFLEPASSQNTVTVVTNWLREVAAKVPAK